jgi:hypothetical protein
LNEIARIDVKEEVECIKAGSGCDGRDKRLEILAQEMFN